MSAPLFERVAVVGLGLLGGSVGLAARARGVAGRVVGVTRGRDSAAQALARGAVDEAVRDPRGVEGAALVVLATPVHAMAGTLRGLAPHLAAGALVTDVGSVKGGLAETLPGLLPPGATYLGSHPMAGSHHSGLAHARADLFEGAACVLTPEVDTPAEALRRLGSFWRALGARVVERDPVAHDEEVAWVSHVPHALAFAFAAALADAPARAGALAGAGFRDFTRIARSEPELWANILVHNRKALAAPLERVAGRLATLARAVESGDVEATHRLLADAREALARVVTDARSGGANPEIEAAPQRAATKE